MKSVYFKLPLAVSVFGGRFESFVTLVGSRDQGVEMKLSPNNDGFQHMGNIGYDKIPTFFYMWYNIEMKEPKATVKAAMTAFIQEAVTESIEMYGFSCFFEITPNADVPAGITDSVFTEEDETTRQMTWLEWCAATKQPTLIDEKYYISSKAHWAGGKQGDSFTCMNVIDLKKMLDSGAAFLLTSEYTALVAENSPE